MVSGFAIASGTALTLLGVAGLHGGCLLWVGIGAVVTGVAVTVWGCGLASHRERELQPRGM